MKIAINKTVIDTKDIYQISPIDSNHSVDDMSFSIWFFNNEKFEVLFSLKNYYGENWLDPYKVKGNFALTEDSRAEIRGLLKKAEHAFNAIRNQIIDLWNEDKLTIPEIDC